MRYLKEIKPNESEAIYFELYNVIEPYVDELIEKAYKAGECGVTSSYIKYLDASNSLYAAMMYISLKKKAQAYKDEDKCEDTEGFDSQLKCIEEGFRCRSASVDTDLVTPFKEMLIISGSESSGGERNETIRSWKRRFHGS